jgi:hypothetical protein
MAKHKKVAAKKKEKEKEARSKGEGGSDIRH